MSHRLNLLLRILTRASYTAPVIKATNLPREGDSGAGGFRRQAVKSLQPKRTAAHTQATWTILEDVVAVPGGCFGKGKPLGPPARRSIFRRVFSIKICCWRFSPDQDRASCATPLPEAAAPIRRVHSCRLEQRSQRVGSLSRRCKLLVISV